MLPIQSIFHWTKELENGRNQIWRWVWEDSPGKTGNVFHSLQTGMRFCFIMVLKKRSSLSEHEKFDTSAKSELLDSTQIWCFAQVPGDPQGSFISSPKRKCTWHYLLRAVCWTILSMENSHHLSMGCSS